jgi:hypothetical protein
MNIREHLDVFVGVRVIFQMCATAETWLLNKDAKRKTVLHLRFQRVVLSVCVSFLLRAWGSVLHDMPLISFIFRNLFWYFI